VSARKRTLDRLFRYGGEEFVLLLPDTAAADALAVAERLRALVQATPMVDEPVTVSIGVAGLDDGQTQDLWLRRADSVLYAAKNAGRNRVVGASDGVSAEASLAAVKP